MWDADTQAECERLRDAYGADLEAEGQRSAADTLQRDWADFVTFYHYPREHWVHLRTSNPVESIFAGVRLRTNAAKRMRRREAALYLVFKVIGRLSGNWRALNGGRSLMGLVLEGDRFQDGVRIRRSSTPASVITAA
jgi:transposase-like protein